jgi:hypothetical protein
MLRVSALGAAGGLDPIASAGLAGAATNKGIDIDEVNSTPVERDVAPTAIGADIETGRVTS